MNQSKNTKFTPGERRVLFWLSYGYCDKHIAKLLDLALFTVRNHMFSALTKSQFDTRLKLGLWVYQQRVKREAKRNVT